MNETVKLAGLAGLLSVGLGVVGVAVDEMWTFPGTGTAAGEIAAFADAHRSALLVASLFNTTAVVLWLVFGAGVWLRLREAVGDESLLPACFLIGIVSFVTLLLAGFTAFFLLAYRAGGAPSDPRLLYDLAFGLLAMSGAPTALALGSYAALVVNGDAPFPRWTALLAAFAAVAHLVLLASFVVTGGFFSLEGGVVIAIPGTLFAWIAGTSTAMVMAARSDALGDPRLSARS